MMQRRARGGLDPNGMADPLSVAVAQRDRSTMDMVRRALEHKQVLLAYQPIIQATEGKIAFYEGLIRILDETGRIIPAKEFIHVIEETEMGRMIDCLALEKGLRSLRKNPDLRLSINMSARSIGYGRWKAVLDRKSWCRPLCPSRGISICSVLLSLWRTRKTRIFWHNRASIVCKATTTVHRLCVRPGPKTPSNRHKTRRPQDPCTVCISGCCFAPETPCQVTFRPLARY